MANENSRDPTIPKSEIITSILEQQMGVGRLTGSHKSIIDRCTANGGQTTRSANAVGTYAGVGCGEAEETGPGA